MPMNKRKFFVGCFAFFFMVIMFSSIFVVFTGAVIDDSLKGPVIDSVSPISAIRLQPIIIRGSGFGDVQPRLMNLSDGSVATLVDGDAPVLRIYDIDGWNSWEAGCEDSQWVPKGLIGVYLVSWSDKEIVLGGFGDSLSVNGEGQWNIKVGDPLIVNVQTSDGMAAYTLNVVDDQPDANSFPVSRKISPIISSVSPILASRLQTIVIRGSGFGDVQPSLLNLGDGSVNTVGGGNTPTLRIYNQNGLQSWQAGVQDNPSSGADAIGVVLVSWNDTEIVLGGFGNAVGTNGEGLWDLSPGDPILISVLTVNGSAAYTTTVLSTGSEEFPTPNPTMTPPPALAAPELEVSCKTSTGYSNFRVEIFGNLAYNSTGISGVPILLFSSVDGGVSWIQLTIVSTDANGDFLAVWFPIVTGNYLLKAEFSENNGYSAVDSTINFVISPSGDQNVFSVTSNSMISAFAFNSTSEKFDFVVSGDSGTTGYIALYLPKSLLDDLSNLRVFLDGNSISFDTKSLDDSWFVTFHYSHSTHEVTIKMDAEVENSAIKYSDSQWLPYDIVALTIVAVSLLLTIRNFKKTRNSKTIFSHLEK
jgi:hypothetical protein